MPNKLKTFFKEKFLSLKKGSRDFFKKIVTNSSCKCKKYANSKPKVLKVCEKVSLVFRCIKNSIRIFYKKEKGKVFDLVQRIIKFYLRIKEHLVIRKVKHGRKIRQCFKDEYYRITNQILPDDKIDLKLNVAVRLRMKGIKKPLDLFRTVRVFEYTLRSFGLDVEGALHKAYKCFNLSRVYTKRDLLRDKDITRNQLLARNFKKLVDQKLINDKKYQANLNAIISEYDEKIARTSKLEEIWKLKNQRRIDLNKLYEEYSKSYENFILPEAHKETNYDLTSLKMMLGLNENC